jgi:serine/alanine adding enzyme
MMYNIINDSTKIMANISNLTEFVNLHPYANIFQSVEAYNFFKTATNHEPVLIVVEDDGEILGSLLALIITEGKGLKGYLSRRCIVTGGPLVKNENRDVYSAVLGEFNSIISKKAIYTQFRNAFNTNNYMDLFSEYQWIYGEHLNIIVDLNKSQDELWKDVHSKRRNEIRRAGKEGTTFRPLNHENELEETYKILKEVYARVKLPFPDLKYFQKAYEYLSPNHLKIFCAICDEKIIGVMYALCYGDTIYDWYAGSYQKYYKKYPNDLIPWEVFLWGKQNGYNKFDFGGAGKPNVINGVRDYKKKFGGEFVNYGRYEKIHQPLRFKMAKLGLALWKKLK